MRHSRAKALVSIALILMLVLTLCAPAFAETTMLSKQKLTVDGKAIECEKYNIDGYNYFKLRDLAELLNGTTSQFDVDYDEATKTMIVTTGEKYTHKNGTELKTGVDNSASAVRSPQTLKVDGEVVDLTAYNIGDVNFFKLRDLGKVLHFYVNYDEATNTAKVKAQREEEDWETGDASKDDPRNADGIGEKELLVVSFGTSFNNNRVETIGAVEAAMEKAFPDYSVRRAFTAQIIINHVYDRDDEKIDNFGEALQRAYDNKVKELVVVPTHLMDGFEYNDVVNELKDWEGKFEKITVSKPILTADEDYDAVIAAITSATAAQAAEEGTAASFMGHGTAAASNHVYADMQAKLTEKGYKNYFIGTVEAEPTLQDVVDAVKAAGFTKVYCEPLMIVAGDHANNDMADFDDDESWVSLFKAAGIEATPILKGLGSFPEIQQLLVEHVKAAIEANAGPTRKIAETADASVAKEGATPVTAAMLKDGTYDITVNTGAKMFKIPAAKLTVSGGKMTAVITMSGTSYTYFFVGESSAIATADASEFIPFVEDAEGKYTFEIPVEALDQVIPCASYSKNKDAWYPRNILFDAASLPAGALK